MSDEYLPPQTLHNQLETAKAPTVIDVRSDEEYAAGHIPGAMHIQSDELERRLDEIPPDRPVVPYCNMHHRGSSRGERAAALLRENGYAAKALDGGFPAWAAAGYPVT